MLYIYIYIALKINQNQIYVNKYEFLCDIKLRRAVNYFLHLQTLGHSLADSFNCVGLTNYALQKSQGKILEGCCNSPSSRTSQGETAHD